jgi:hypothetical protein
MTHDELLAEIKFSRNDFNYIAPHNALRAVVELHKPTTSTLTLAPICIECSKHDKIGTAYPCSTIQAIERELK